jgi:cytidine deaminase
LTKINQLIDSALAARNMAYAPYSNFNVGAAVLLENGEIYSGCNVENASFGLSICAERSAICRAIAASADRTIIAIAVVAHPLAPPCGACRQFIVEFGADIQIVSADAINADIRRTWSSGDLLPDSFEF